MRLLLSVTIAFAFTILNAAPWPGIAKAGRAPERAAFTVDDLLDVVNLSIADLSHDGKWVAATTTSLRDRIGIDNYRFGDPTYIPPSLSELWIINTDTAQSQKLFSNKRQVRAIKWSPDSTRLALLEVKGEQIEPLIWERTSGKLRALKLPAGKNAAENAELEWSVDGNELLLALRSDEWRTEARQRFERETRGPIVVHSSKEPFLAWEDLRKMSLLRSLVAYDLTKNQTRELTPKTKLTSYDLSDDGSFLTYLEDVTKKTDYDTIFGSENQVQLIPAAGGAPRTLIKSTKGINVIWSRDRRTYAYAKDGNVFTGSIEDKEPRQLTGKKEPDKQRPEAASGEPGDDPAKIDSKRRDKERFNTVRLSPRGDRLVASNKEGLWIIDTTTANRELFIKMPEEDKLSPRYEALDWSPDGENLYLTYSSRTTWDRGLARYNVTSKKMEELLKDSKLYSGFRLSRDGSTLVFSSGEGNRPQSLYASDANLKNVRRLMESNPQLKDRQLSRTELVPYLDVDGNKLFGVLYYPVGYESGKKYPTIFIIYEQFFDDNFNGTINILTSNGYAVMQPSVSFETGYPGEAWLKGVTAAANRLIDMGIADADRLGVHGTSYGGYATNLLITQTNRFKAAINISGKVNMVSFYTDSPRLGVRNIHAPEKSQDRVGATLWQQPQKYVQHSAVMFADRIKTPLMLITGEQDQNVPARQAMEMYYALRRLGREVEWVNYINGGHGMPTTTVDEVKDYHSRILSWYDGRLKGELKKKTDEGGEIPQK